MSRVVAYFLLNSLALLGDSIFLYFVSLNLLQFPNGGVLCSVVLGLDAFFEIILGPYICRFIDVIPKLCLRLKRSLILQMIMMCLAFLPVLAVKLHSGSVVTLIMVIAVMRFFSLINMQLKAALPLHLDRQGVMPLMQTLSLSVFSQRCIFLVSSALAPLFLTASWGFTCSLNALLYIPAVFGLYLILKIARPLAPVHVDSEEKEEDPADVEERKRWINWNCTSQLLTSVAFSSVVFILTKSMLLATDESKFLQALKGPSPVYGGLLVALIIMVFLHKKTGMVAKNARRICWTMTFLSIGLIVAAFTDSPLQAVVFFVVGIINGFSLVGGDTFIQRKLKGKGIVAALAKSQAFGRVGFLISLAAAGMCIDAGLSATQMISTCGLFGIITCLILFTQALGLEGNAKQAVQMQK